MKKICGEAGTGAGGKMPFPVKQRKGARGRRLDVQSLAGGAAANSWLRVQARACCGNASKQHVRATVQGRLRRWQAALRLGQRECDPMHAL